ncbi:MAG: glycosyltransferase family 2 protein [Aquificae bacterium]|nr:glycosyltransferase family 2 protein [Aquificota bacterium]
MSDLVSIITPSYKSKKFIKKTIESVLNQTYKNWEMIIVDDCSPDKSNEIIQEYIKKDNRIKLIKLSKNSGPAVARNTAIKEAKGRYIAFLDADDLWLPEKLEKQISFMEEKNLPMTYSSYYMIDEEDNPVGEYIVEPVLTYKKLLKRNMVGCLTGIYDTKKLGKVYMPDILKRQDHGLWLKILKKIGKTEGIVEPLAIYRLRKNSVSSNKIIAAKYTWKLLREVENLNLLQAAYYFGWYIYYGLNKYKNVKKS